MIEKVFEAFFFTFTIHYFVLYVPERNVFLPALSPETLPYVLL